MDANTHSNRYYFRIYLVLILSITTFGCVIPDRKSQGESVSHNIWSEVLSEIVKDNGKVKYSELKREPSKFYKYLGILKNNHPDAEEWSREERLAYWINAYNAFTVQLIIENYPLESIKDLNSTISIPFINTIWDKPFIKIEDYEYSLNDIEHRILRKKFNEPRIHFAINCASISCPDLREEAFSPDKLDEQLKEQAINFINKKSKNLIDGHEIRISKIFSWFGSDFKTEGSLIDFLNKYSKIPIDKNADISYLDYDWSLNE